VIWLSWLAVALIVFAVIYALAYVVALLVRVVRAATRGPSGTPKQAAAPEHVAHREDSLRR
jgi:Na+-transporting methylmalonyl-CoA/oxaloacetate decarboxylase gamma subunit